MLFPINDNIPTLCNKRFRIAAEIATGLLFLYQTKPEPLVHRDLKPALPERCVVALGSYLTPLRILEAFATRYSVDGKCQ
jgi:hypothetical protein